MEVPYSSCFQPDSEEKVSMAGDKAHESRCWILPGPESGGENGPE